MAKLEKWPKFSAYCVTLKEGRNQLTTFVTIDLAVLSSKNNSNNLGVVDENIC